MSAHTENTDGPARPWFRRINLTTKVAVVLFLAVVLFYGLENWRGRVVWERCQAEMKAKGIELDLAKVIPPTLPEADNFAATPLVQEWFRRGSDDGLGTNYNAAAGMMSERRVTKNERHLRDLVLWEKAFGLVASNLTPAKTLQGTGGNPAERAAAAPAVLVGLADSAPGLEELRRASVRPMARYPIDYNLQNPAGILLPHLAKIKQAVLRLQLRANAELALGQGEAALADTRLMADLADSVRDEVFAISLLVRVACWHLTTQTVWEGLAERRWTEPQLRELQARLARVDFVESLRWQMQGELAWVMTSVDRFADNTYSWGGLLAGQDFEDTLTQPMAKRLAYNALWAVTPAGWFSLEKVGFCHYWEVMNDGIGKAGSRRIFLDQIRSNAVVLEKEVWTRNPLATVGGHTLITRITLPALQKISFKAAYTQVALDHAVLGCALERYRLAHGEFPEKLEALVPALLEHLPQDVLSGDNYHYRRTPEGSFLLYSVGWNGTDDGGVPGLELFDEAAGDWIWSYPAPAK